MAGGQSKPLAHTSARVYKAGSQWQTAGVHPKIKRTGLQMFEVPTEVSEELLLPVLLMIYLFLQKLQMLMLYNSWPSPLQQ